jgi:hypothetical protein
MMPVCYVCVFFSERGYVRMYVSVSAGTGSEKECANAGHEKWKNANKKIRRIQFSC